MDALFPWPRPRFQSGGGDAMIYFEIYGEFDGLELAISRSKYNSNGLPDGLNAQLLAPDLSIWNGALGEMLRDSSAQAWELAEKSSRVVKISGTIADPNSLDYLRDVLGVIAAFLDNGGAAVFDPQILSAFTAQAWRDQFFAAAFEPTNHAVILASPDEQSAGNLWLHTRGMRLFGRPDVSCHGVAPDQTEPLQAVFNGLIRMQAAGFRVPDGQIVQAIGVETRLICAQRGSLDDAEFNNVHLELGWEAR